MPRRPRLTVAPRPPTLPTQAALARRRARRAVRRPADGAGPMDALALLEVRLGGLPALCNQGGIDASQPQKIESRMSWSLCFAFFAASWAACAAASAVAARSFVSWWTSLFRFLVLLAPLPWWPAKAGEAARTAIASMAAEAMGRRMTISPSPSGREPQPRRQIGKVERRPPATPGGRFRRSDDGREPGSERG